MTKSNVRNCSIDIFRYICAIMVVAIHTHPFSDVNPELGYIFTQIVPRIGVPFFFATAGYFYIQKLDTKQAAFFPYLKRLLFPYSIWSCLYFAISFIRTGYSNPANFISDCLIQFIFTGSHSHFWFFPALIFSVCFTTLIYKIRLQKALIPLSLVLYTIGCLGCSYYNLSADIPLLGKLYASSHFTLIRRVFLMGFPFFICGHLVSRLNEKIFADMPQHKLLFVWLASAALWLAEIHMVRTLGWQENIIITFGLYSFVAATLLILLKNPLSQYASFAAKSKLLANFTYYSHPFVIICLSFADDMFLHISLTETPLFFLTVILTFVGGIIIYKANNKWLNKIAN